MATSQFGSEKLTFTYPAFSIGMREYSVVQLGKVFVVQILD